MSNLIQQWNSKKGTKRNYSFLKKSSQKKKLVAQADAIHTQVFSELDCLDCANCCTSIPPIVNRVDAARIAKVVGMKTKQFTDTYLIQDEDGDWVMNASPCPFLQEDHKCSIYDDRPRACREFPHTDGESFVSNMGLHLQNTRYCPAVFHILERLSHL